MCGVYTVAEQIELRFMFHNFHGLFEFFPYVFDSPITFLTLTFFLSGKLGRGREQVFPPFSTKPGLGVCVYNLLTHTCMSLVERIFACMQVCGALGSTVCAFMC